MRELDTPVIPASVRSNHWMNQVAGHAENRPDATAFRYLGADMSWSQRFEHPTHLVVLDELARNASGKGSRRENDPA